MHELYTSFKENSLQKLHNLSRKNPELAHTLSETLAEHSVRTIEETVIEDLYQKELITPKLYVLLKKELSIISE